MTVPIVIARATFPYDGITRRIGESFEATSKDAQILALIGRVSIANDPIPLDGESEAVLPSTPARRATRRKEHTADSSNA